MKKTALIILVFFSASFASVPIQAIPINGSITGYSGDALVTMANDYDWTDATKVMVSIRGFSVKGDYVQGISYTPFPIFEIDAQHTPKTPLWVEGSETGTYGTKVVSFDIISLTFTSTAKSISAYGDGIAYMTGFDPTYATWSVEVQPQGYGRPLWVGFSQSTFVASGVAVPDGGSTALILGLALLGVGLIRRKGHV